MLRSKYSRNGHSGNRPALPAYLPLAEVATLVGVPVSALQQKIQDGTISAITIHGKIAMSEQDARRAVPKVKLPEYKRFDHLKGKPIWINEAARKYSAWGLYQRLISLWTKKGLIKKIRDDGNRVLVDEQDVAYCALIYQKNKHRGRKVFQPDGTPYMPTK
jgi:predicted site-specific integrase-resolvase